jgi:hypothetical protein
MKDINHSPFEGGDQKERAAQVTPPENAQERLCTWRGRTSPIDAAKM